MKIGTAPASITVFVCMDVPDAMLVSAHAASNCRKEDKKLKIVNLLELEMQKILVAKKKDEEKTGFLEFCRWRFVFTTLNLL